MRAAVVLSAIIVVAAGAGDPAVAAAPPSALALANASFATVDDYRTTVSVHETDGKRVEDRTYRLMFKKPTLERVDVLAGPGKGGGIVWLGGEKVKGHHGGMLSGIRLTFDLHDPMVRSLRGDSIDSATIPSMLADFTPAKGTLSEAPGPQIAGSDSVAVTLAVADPAATGGVTREVMYLSAATHLPVRRDRFAGASLVKTEEITELTTNVGLTTADFPW